MPYAVLGNNVAFLHVFLMLCVRSSSLHPAFGPKKISLFQRVHFFEFDSLKCLSQPLNVGHTPNMSHFTHTWQAK